MNQEPTATPSGDPLARPATRALVLRLAAEGHLDAAARDVALRLVEPPRAWWLWTERLLLAIGAALVLAGVIFFFAYNWAAIPPLAKLGIAQALVALFAVAAWRLGLDSALGQACLAGASVATGATLAVFGQIYQTGADSYELFVGWAALTVGWTVAARSAAHWILWVAIVDLAIWLYWDQVFVPADRASWVTGLLALAAVNAATLVAAHRAESGSAGMRPASLWARWILWASVLFFLTVPACVFIADAGDWDNPWALVALPATLAIGYWYFRRRARDLFSITLGTLSACAVVLTAIARAFQGGEELALLSFGLIVLAVFSGATVWLRSVGAALARERSDE
jgi:uncharacterized membrane protein